MSIGSTIEMGVSRLVAPVEGMHRAISGRWFSLVGPVGRPVQVVHDTISGFVYRSIRVGAAAAGIAVDARTDGESPRAEAFQAFANGMWGDSLGHRGPRLGIPMTVRDSDGAPVTIPELAAAFSEPTGRLVVLLHGLVETERSWSGTETRPGLDQAIGSHPALTAIPIRYNTGLRVSDNGTLLAGLLEELQSGWPVPVDSIVLVGHSMGGLVARSACIAAGAARHQWIDHLSDVVTIGSPHRGAPLEKLVNVVAWGLAVAPQTRPLADFLNGRSAGIKDLRFGAIAEDDWRGIDPDALLRNTVGDHELTPGVGHHFIAGVVTNHPRHPLGVIAGDFMVRAGSGTGGGRLQPTNVAVLGGSHHFDLLHEPEVVATVMGWLSAA